MIDTSDFHAIGLKMMALLRSLSSNKAARDDLKKKKLMVFSLLIGLPPAFFDRGLLTAIIAAVVVLPTPGVPVMRIFGRDRDMAG